jgi:hypothetical protein
LSQIGPFGIGNLGGVLEKFHLLVNIQDLVRLVVLENGIPTASGASATRDLSSLFNGLGTTAFTWATVPGPVDTRFGTTRIVGDLKETLSSLVFTNKSTWKIVMNESKQKVSQQLRKSHTITHNNNTSRRTNKNDRI